MKIQKIASAVSALALLLTALAASGCSSGESGDAQLRIAYFPNITHSQALVMKDKKSLETTLGEKCTVQWTSFNAGPAEVEAIFAGEIDIGYIGPVPAINANVKSNGEVKIIANACDAGAVLIKAKDSEIGSVKELSGKTVAIPQLGNTQHLCLLNLLTENGLSPKSESGNVEVVAVSNADLQGMLERGDVDAALVPEPWGSILEKNCGAQVVLDFDEVFLSGAYPSAVVIVNGDFYSKHRDIVEQFLKAHREATAFINENKDEAAVLVDRQILEATGKSIGTDIISLAFQRLTVTDKVSADAISAFAKIGVEQGFISSKPSDGIVDTEIIDSLS